MFNRILVVCMGNICRSPLGEASLKAIMPNKAVCSAGIATEPSGLIGQPADSMMQSVSANHGLELNEHKAQQLTQDLCDSNDLILVMEPAHIDLVASIAPNNEVSSQGCTTATLIGEISMVDSSKRL